jgi:FkbM family methyltransferase
MTRNSPPNEPHTQDLTERLQRVEAKLDEALSSLDFLTGRLSTYVGKGVALTYLADGAPIYVNSDDFGPPANFISGGRYEEDNLAVLLSFVRCDTRFLDVGANLGFFSLQVAARAINGEVHAYEPHPGLARLANASAYLNGYSQLAGGGRLQVHQIGLSDVNGQTVFSFPLDHLGGGGVGGGRGGQTFKGELRRLDDLLPADFICDLIKIDVEGHEPQAIAGMEATLRRSPNIKILFEKLTSNAGFEAKLEAFFDRLGFSLFGVEAGARLRPLGPGALSAFTGYVLASREKEIDLSRARISIYPRQLRAVDATCVSCGRDVLRARAQTPLLLFHGPYWMLPRGIHRLTMVGDVQGAAKITVATRFGHPVQSFRWTKEAAQFEIRAPRDLQHFEVVATAEDGGADISISRIDIERVG